MNCTCITGKLLLPLLNFNKINTLYPLTSQLDPAYPIDKNAPLSRQENDPSTSAYLEKTTWPLVTPSHPVMTVPLACLSLECSVLLWRCSRNILKSCNFSKAPYKHNEISCFCFFMFYTVACHQNGEGFALRVEIALLLTEE